MNHWKASWNGVKTVAGLELRLRVRSKRWIAALVAWFAILGGLTLLLVNYIDVFGGSSGDQQLNYCYVEADGAETCYLPADANGWDTTCKTTDGGAITCAHEYTGPCTDAAGNVTACDSPNSPVLTTCSAEGGVMTCDIPGGERYLDRTCVIEPGNDEFICTYHPVDGWLPSAGPLVFSLITCFVLGLGLLITPALTSTSINGDRQAATLATLQATKLSALDIAAGKLIAAWLTVFAFLVVALPWLATGMVIGSIDLGQVVGCFLVLLAELAIVSAIGLGWSAVSQRSSASTLATYGTVFLLTLFTPVLMILTMPFIKDDDFPIMEYGLPPAVQTAWTAEWYEWIDAGGDPEDEPPAPLEQCGWRPATVYDYRTDYTWWILAANPFVIVADAAPEPAIARDHPNIYQQYAGNDLLNGLRGLVRGFRDGPATTSVAWPCNEVAGVSGDVVNGSDTVYIDGTPDDTSPIWPWGLGFSALVGGVLFWVAVRRLSVPYGPLPKGTRVA
jgi:hypothetical protein